MAPKVTERNPSLAEGRRLEAAGDPRRRRIIEAYAAYIELGTMQLAGNRLGVTRERIRQLIAKGIKLRLFADPVGEPCPYSKRELLSLLTSFGSAAASSAALGVAPSAIARWLRERDVTPTEIRQSAIAFRRSKCIEEYRQLSRQLGHEPTTTELEFHIPGARALYARIARHWGSFDAFRDEQGIAKPPQGNPRFREDVAPSLQRLHYFAYLRREQAAEQILDILRKRRSSTLADLRREIAIGPHTLEKVLRQLRVRGLLRVNMRGNCRHFSLEEE